MMEINSDELAELIEDEPGIHVELSDGDPDGIYIEWSNPNDEYTYNALWAVWETDQTYVVSHCVRHELEIPDTYGLGDMLTVNEILDIVL